MHWLAMTSSTQYHKTKVNYSAKNIYKNQMLAENLTSGIRTYIIEDLVLIKGLLWLLCCQVNPFSFYSQKM